MVSLPLHQGVVHGLYTPPPRCCTMVPLPILPYSLMEWLYVSLSRVRSRKRWRVSGSSVLASTDLACSSPPRAGRRKGSFTNPTSVLLLKLPYVCPSVGLLVGWSDHSFLKGSAHSKNVNLHFLALAQRNWMQSILVSHEALFWDILQKTDTGSSKLHAPHWTPVIYIYLYVRRQLPPP